MKNWQTILRYSLKPLQDPLLERNLHFFSKRLEKRFGESDRKGLDSLIQKLHICLSSIHFSYLAFERTTMFFYGLTVFELESLHLGNRSLAERTVVVSNIEELQEVLIRLNFDATLGRLGKKQHLFKSIPATLDDFQSYFGLEEKDEDFFSKGDFELPNLVSENVKNVMISNPKKYREMYERLFKPEKRKSKIETNLLNQKNPLLENCLLVPQDFDLKTQ